MDLHPKPNELAMVERTLVRAEELGIGNLRCEQRDVFEDGFGVTSRSQDSCLLFNILHCENPVRVLQEAARVIADQASDPKRWSGSTGSALPSWKRDRGDRDPY
jgi:hypothetical protein